MLTALIVLVLLLIALVLFLLFLPVVLMINTMKDLYQVQWGPARAAFSFNEEHARYRLHLPFWTREGELHALIEGTRQRPEAVPAPKARAGRPEKRRMWRPPLRALLHTFRVRRFHWSWDTGDPLWNAWLFPALHLLRMRGHDVAISFTGRNELILTLDNNLYRVLKTVLFHRSPINNQRT